MRNQAKVVESLQNEITREHAYRRKFQNEIEQNHRRNNIRIFGVNDNNKRESARETANIVVDMLKSSNVIDISLYDIEYAYRLPNRKRAKRDIIVRFVSGYTKEEIMKTRRNLKGSGVFINEDLTPLNLEVLMSVKKKMPDEVRDAWASNGRIMMKNAYGRVSEISFDDYEHWLELPWPNTTKDTNTTKPVDTDVD